MRAWHWFSVVVLGVGCGSGSGSAGGDAAPGGDGGGGSDVVVLAADQDHPWGVAIDDTHVYFTCQGDGTVKRVPKDGGAVETLASGLTYPRAIGVDDQEVFWGDGGRVHRAPLAGAAGAPTDWAASSGEVDTLVVTESQVWWLSTSTGVVAHENKQPNIATVGSFFREGLPSPIGLAVDDGLVFWTTQGDGSLWSQSTAALADPVALIADDGAGPARIALDATTVFWVGQADGTIRKVPRGGGDPTLLGSGASGGSFLTAAGTHVYYSNDDAGEVLTVPKTGGDAVVLARDLDTPLGIAADADGVYVATATGIVRIPAP